MYSHPNKSVNTGEEAAAAAAASFPPSPNLPNNEPMSTSWSPDEDDFDTDAIPNADLSPNPYSSSNEDNDSLASSPPPVFLTSSSKKGKQPSKFPPTNPFSSAYKPVHKFTPPPRLVDSYNTDPFRTPAATPTPPPRSGRSSELLAARIAAYEARTIQATARATTKCTTGPSPSLNQVTRSSPALPSLDYLHVAATQRFPAHPSNSANNPNYSQEPRITSTETPSTPSRTTETNPQRLNKGKGIRSSSVSSQLSPYAEFYDAATKKFPGSSYDASLASNYSEQVRGSPGPSRRRSGIVLSELEEEVVRRNENEHAVEDEEEDWEKEEEEDLPSPGLPPVLHFQVSADDNMSAFTVGAPSSGHAVLADDENDPSYSRVNFVFSRSTIPPRNEHSEPLKFSKRKLNREDVLRIYLDGFPKYEVSNVFFDQIDETKRINEEAKRRATCIDDPDADLTQLPTCVKHEDIMLPLHERLSNMLPSPSNFTPSLGPDPFTIGTYEYRPRGHGLRAITIASTAPDLELKDESLRARAVHYSKNREVIGRALKEDGMLREAPDVVHALECQRCRSLKGVGSIYDRAQSPADVDALQSLILEQQELKQDLERLEATMRGVQASFSTLGSLPIGHRFGNAKQRQTLAEKKKKQWPERQRQVLAYYAEQEREEGGTGADNELSGASVAMSCPFDRELNRALAACDPIVEHLANFPSMSIATANLATGGSFPFVD